MSGACTMKGSISAKMSSVSVVGFPDAEGRESSTNTIASRTSPLMRKVLGNLFL